MKIHFTRRKNRLFLLFLLTVFLAGMTGRLLLSDAPQESHAVTLTVRSHPEDAYFLSFLPTSETDATLDGFPVTILTRAVRPATRTRLLPEGGTRQYTSLLFSEAEFSLRLEGEERDGRFFTDGIYLPLGKECSLATRDFILTVRILEIKRV